MTDLRTEIEQALQHCITGAYTLRWDTDRKGVTTAWCRLANSEDLLPVATALKKIPARLSAITASTPDHSQQSGTHELAYHFDLDGNTLTITVNIAPEAAVPSLTPLFRNADWNEREFMELYNIKVEGCQNSQRLFIDESIEPSVLDRLIPFSALVNAASTKTLWEKILDQNEAAR